MEYIDKNFDTSKINFIYNFTPDECYALKNGICSLEEYNKFLCMPDFNWQKERDNFPLCVCIYFGIRDKTFKRRPPYLSLMKCGHYMFTDGRHRICVAKKCCLLLEVVISVEDELCFDCQDKL